MQAENVVYRDFDLSMRPNPLTKDVVLVNLQAIKRSIRNLFMLDSLDIPFDTSSYFSIRQMLFEPVNEITQGALLTLIEWIVKTYEPRVNLKKVAVDIDQSETGYNITLFFTVKSMGRDDRMDIHLKRVR